MQIIVNDLPAGHFAGRVVSIQSSHGAFGDIKIRLTIGQTIAGKADRMTHSRER